jgi:hypothetical protein
MQNVDQFNIDIVAAVGSMMAAYVQFTGDDTADHSLAEDVIQAADHVLDLAGDDDLAAFARASALTVLGRSEDLLPVCHHSAAFFILRLDGLISNNGEHEVWEWLLRDPADVRSELGKVFGDAAWEEMVDPETGVMQSNDDDSSLVEIHIPGMAPAILDVFRAVRPDEQGEYGIDWSVLALPSLGELALATDRPVRVHGMTYDYGINLTDAFEMPY